MYIYYTHSYFEGISRGGRSFVIFFNVLQCLQGRSALLKKEIDFVKNNVLGRTHHQSFFLFIMYTSFWKETDNDRGDSR